MKDDDNDDGGGGGESRKGSSPKLMWYLPIITRFKRLLTNVYDTKNIRRHIDERDSDGKIIHAADSWQWKIIYSLFSHFGHAPRNIILVFTTNGMNLLGILSTNHTSWSLLLIIHNYLCGFAWSANVWNYL